MQGAEREQILSTSNGQAQVTHRGERQIIYEAFSNVHAAGIAFREEIRPLTTTPRPLLSQKSPEFGHIPMWKREGHIKLGTSRTFAAKTA